MYTFYSLIKVKLGLYVVLNDFIYTFLTDTQNYLFFLEFKKKERILKWVAENIFKWKWALFISYNNNVIYFIKAKVELSSH